MSYENIEKATYLVQTDGTLVLNPAGIELVERYRRAQAEQKALAASWTGAVLARLFLQHAWLDAVTLSFTATSEYDDSGGYYRCIGCRAQAVKVVALAPLPEDLYPDGVFDPDAAGQVLEAELEDDEHDLYDGLSGAPGGYDDLAVTLARQPIAALLPHGPIDGHAAFDAWGLSSTK